MSSACVCHTGEWCFYCEMYVPLEKERDELRKSIEGIKYKLTAARLDLVKRFPGHEQIQAYQIINSILKSRSQNES